jgi:outer membrane protein, heavy metal efflux system
MTKLLALLLGAFLLIPSLNAQSPEPLSLEQVLHLAEEKNPDIQAARKSYEAARAAIAPARAWPDPMLSISREKFPEGDRMNHLMVEQDIPFPGKKRAEGAMKRHEALIAEARYRAKTLQVLAEARILYYKLYRTDQLIQQLSQNVDVMKATLRVAQTRLQSPAPQKSGGPSSLQSPGMSMGGSAQPMGTSSMGSSAQTMGADIFSLMTELGRMENMLFEEKQMRTMLAYGLNALLDRDLNTPVAQTSTLELADIPRPLPELLKLTGQHGPMYLSALHEERHARAMLTRSRLGFAPDFGVMYDRMTGAGGMKGSEAGVRVMVPLWVSRPVGELKEAKAHLHEAEAMAKAMRNEAFKMVSMEFTETNTHLTQARNYRDSIIPSAQSAFKLTRRQYESGGGNYLRLLESVRTLISVQTEYYNQLYHYGEHWALLEQWVGAPLSSAPSTQEKPHE